MSNTQSYVLVDFLPGQQTAYRDVLWVVGFSLLTALMAQISITLPFDPVPITGQTFAVLLSGAVLGSRRGFLCQALYLAEGAFGLPVFAPIASYSFIHLLGPTGGYLLSYPLAAGLVGWLVERGASGAMWKIALALVAGDFVILIAGASWLEAVYRFSPRQAWLLGVYPFLIGDVLKIALVGITLPPFLRRYRRGIKSQGQG
jgi:biotin transport system substrate-specific component